MEFEYEKHVRREMRKGYLMDILKKTAVVVGISAVVAGGVYLGQKSQEEQIDLISSFNETIDYPVSQEDTYWDYAKNIQEKYPELKGLNVNDIAEKIQDLNGNKPLNYSDSIRLPVYDFSASAEKE